MTKVQNKEGFISVEKQSREKLVSVFTIIPGRNNRV